MIQNENEFAIVRDLFIEALELEGLAAQLEFAAQRCGDTLNARAELERMLRAHHHRDGFLESQPEVTQSTSAIAVKPGKRIGPYKIREQLAEGGMGVVYVAEQTQPVRRKVALKIIKPGMATTDVVARFEAERQALAMMEHPNIAVFDGGATDAGQPFFVMELVRGIPITEFCDQQRLPTRQRLQLFVKVCLAVQHAHQKGIIHRDIKPSNVLVGELDGAAVPKIIDFGVSKAVGQSLTEQTVYTQFSQMVGTPLYMSPEQAGMGIADIDKGKNKEPEGAIRWSGADDLALLQEGGLRFGADINSDGDVSVDSGLDGFNRFPRGINERDMTGFPQICGKISTSNGMLAFVLNPVVVLP